jgi:hypothetical protein
MCWYETINDDSGSLLTGGLRLREGDLIQVEGEPKPRRVSYVMGSDRNGWRVCTRGFGAFPYGPVRWRLVEGKPEPLRPPDGRASATQARATGTARPMTAPAPAEAGSAAKALAPAGRTAPLFDRYVGIDYSGAETPTSRLSGLRVYVASRGALPDEVRSPTNPEWNWTRREIAEWLVERLAESPATLVGIDHGFSFPLQYFEAHGLPHDWAAFLDDFQRHWPTDEDHVYVDFVRCGTVGDGAARTGDTHWRRRVEVLARAKSVFHFGVSGQVAPATHAGLPWLRYLRQRLGVRVHFWPFDGWEIAPGRSAIAEVYPRLWSGRFPRGDRTGDQYDAYSVAAWLRESDLGGTLAGFLSPALDPTDREVANIEGWILGVR